MKHNINDAPKVVPVAPSVQVTMSLNEIRYILCATWAQGTPQFQRNLNRLFNRDVSFDEAQVMRNEVEIELYGVDDGFEPVLPSGGFMGAMRALDRQYR